jgi:T1SS-143 domain-containing protein
MRYDDISSGNPLSGSSTMADAEGGPAAGGQVRLAQAGEIDAQSLLEEGREAAGNETAENEVAENGEADEVVRQVILAREGEVVVLPVGTSIDEIEIRDDDIVLVQPDGSIIIIENGVAMVPTIQIGDVEIPAETLAAVIEGIAVAAGPEGGDGVLGSGGNFFVQPGDIGDPFPISPLLPPTELGFPELEDEEILQPLAEDEEVPGVAPPPPSLITPSLTAGSSVNHNETPGIQWSVNPSHDVAFDDLPEDIQGIFGDFGETEPLFGEDPHVPEEKMDAFGAIGFAWSYDEELNPGPQVVVSPPEGGVEPITRTFALQTEDGTFSGLFTTEGVPIFLFNGPDGLILGRLGSLPGEEVRLALVEEGGSDGPSIGLHQPDPDGEIAFALIAWSPDGGESIYFISAQWLSLYHDDTDDVNELAFLADGTVQLVVTDTDSVGQEEGADMDVSGLFGFRDDGPNLDLSANEDGDERLLSLVMDESVVDDPSTDEDDPDQVSNAGIDDVEDNGGFRTFDPDNMTSDVSGLEDTEFGHKTTQSDALAGLFDIPETFDFGSDGPASEDPVSYQFSLVLNGQDDNGGVATGLKVTAVAGTALADLEDHERTIWLFEEDGKIVGRVGETSADAETGLIALVIELEGADTDNPTLSVKQYIPIQHDETDQHDEPALMTLAEGGSLALKLDLEITDGDGDTESGSAEYVLADHSGSFLTIEDDGPREFEVTANEDGDERLLSLVMDESVVDDPSTDEDDPDQVSNAGIDDVEDNGGFRTFDPDNMTSDVSGLEDTEFGHKTTQSDALAGLFDIPETFDFGSDGPASEDPVSYQFSLVLNGQDDNGGVATGLKVTAVAGTALADLEDHERTIWLFEEDGKIVGRVGETSADAETGLIALVIELEGADTDNPTLSVKQYIPIQHDETDQHDEPALMTLAEGGSLALKLDLEITDGDGDTESGSAEYVLADHSGSFLTIEDDGPREFEVTANEDGDERLLSLVMDESVVDDPSTDEDDPDQVSNAGIDDVEDNGGFRTFDPDNMTSDVSGLEDTEFGHKTTQSDALAGLFDIPETFDFGSDGPASEDPVSYQFSLVLNGQDDNGGVATGLKVTAVAGTALADLEDHERTIWLFEEDGKIVGRVGETSADAETGLIALVIELEGADTDNPTLSVKQYIPIQHDETDQHDEPALMTLAEGGSLALKLDLEITDGDGDTESGSAEYVLADHSGSFLTIEDDGPREFEVTANEDGDERLLSLVMDESVVDDPSTDEDDPDQVSNAGIDDVEDNGGFRTFDPDNMTSDVSGLEDTEFGHKTTQSDALAGLFDIPETFDFGSDGPASEDPVSYQFSLVLNGQDDNGGVATGLKVTAVAGTALADLEDHERTIWLFEEDGKIVGRVGETSADAETGLIALVIELEGADTDNPTLSVKQYIPIQHDETDQHDEPALMTLAEGGSLALKLDLEITDGDGDTESGSAEYVLADHSGSFLTIEDDGPRTIGGLEVEATVFEGAIIPGGTGEHPEDPDPFQSTASSVLAGSLLALVAFGTDGAHASEAFSFNVDLSKLEDQALTSGGEELVYSVSSEGADVAIGYDVVLIATKGSADGEVVFRLHLNHTSGDWLFELVGGLDHEAPPAGTADYNELVVDFSDVIVARDGDGDTISLDADSFAIAIVDDVPVAGEDVQTLVLANTLENFGSASLDIDFGADGFGALVLTKAMGADGTQVDLMHGNGVYGVVTNGDGTSEVQQLSSGGIPLVWRDNGDGTWSAVREGTQDDDAPAPSAFTVTLNSDGTYTVEMDGDNPIALDATKTTFTLDFTTGGISGGNDDQLIFFDSDPSDATIMVLVTSNEENVNSSVQGMGVGNNFINTGQIMRLDFGDPVDPDLIDGADDDDFVYQYISTSTIELNSLGNNDEALVEVVLESGESVYFRIPGSGSGNVKNSLLIQQGVEGEGAVTGDGTEGDPYELTIVDGQAVAYVDEHFATLYFSGDGYRLLSAQGSDFSEESLDISTSFTVDAIDFDGDYATTEFDVKFKSGNEITGTEGSDVIVGNPDQTESLIGLEGDDVFVLNSFDFHDIIVDYDFNNSLGWGSDVIDITQLLELYNADNADVDAETFIQYKVELDGDQLLVDTNGDGAHDTLVAKITTAPTHVAFMIDGQTYDESGNLIA